MELGWPQVLTIVGANFIMLITAIGITITLWIHSNKRIDSILKAVNEEMKDFHGKLCSIKKGNG